MQTVLDIPNHALCRSLLFLRKEEDVKKQSTENGVKDGKLKIHPDSRMEQLNIQMKMSLSWIAVST